jgi:hypothetical protein
MKKYRVTIELDTFEFIVSAKDKKEAKEKAAAIATLLILAKSDSIRSPKDKKEAKEKALNNLQKKKISTMIRKGWPDNKRQIFIDEE